AVVAFARAECGKRGRRRHARRTQREILQARHWYYFEPIAREFRAVTAEHESLLRGRHAFAFAAPSVMFQPCIAHGILPHSRFGLRCPGHLRLPPTRPKNGHCARSEKCW